MKGARRQIAALITAAVMAVTMTAPVYADFVDPAQVYAQYQSQKQNPADNNNPSQTEISESDLIEGELPEDNEFKETSATESETAPAETTSPEETQPAGTEKKEDAASDKNTSKVTKPAQEVIIYSYKTKVNAGDTFKIGYRLKPSRSDDTVTYSVSNSKVAEIDSEGNVTAKKKGGVIITVKASSGVKDRFSLTVTENKSADEDEPQTDTDNIPEDNDDAPSEPETDISEATDIELKHTAVTISEGETYKIRYELTPKNSTDTVSFRSINKAVASVSKDGTITARGAGNTRIVCQTGGGAYTKLSVTVLDVMTEEQQEQQIEQNIEKEYNESGELVPSEVRFGSESAGLMVGEQLSLDARIFPSGSVYTYTIKSDNTKVAKVNSRGVVTGISPGNAIITVTTNNGKSDSIYITVYDGVIKGIDVSKWNGDINWKKVKNTGMAQFAMIRASYGYEDTDPRLEQNVRGCEKNDIPYGFYHYMYAKNVAEAKKEAAYFLNVIQNYNPEYPVVLDIEEDFYKQMSKKEVTQIVTTFMEAVENAGYYAMIYSYAKFFGDSLIMDKIEKYDIWVACWGDEDKLAESYSYHYGMWQYSETGRIAGIEEDVDLNYSLKDYRAIIKKYGLNNP